MSINIRLQSDHNLIKRQQCRHCRSIFIAVRVDKTTVTVRSRGLAQMSGVPTHPVPPSSGAPPSSAAPPSSLDSSWQLPAISQLCTAARSHCDMHPFSRTVRGRLARRQARACCRAACRAGAPAAARHRRVRNAGD